MENPKIRFKGFTKDWEQRKLSEITTMHARIGWQNLRTSEFLDSGDYMLITGTDFNDGAINYSTCHFVERERYEQDKHIQIKNGSILITKDGTLGKVAYVQGLSMPATLNAGVFNVEIKDETEVNDKYLFQYLKAPFLMDYVNKKATGGTIKHLNQNILVDFPVFMPSKAEQEEIGTYFEKLDNLITLHQRKCEQTKKLKKYMLQKMFPQNGAKVPEIRFDGFTYDWEQRKLGYDLVSIHTGTNLLGSITNTGMPLIKMGNIQRGYFDTSKVEFLAENEQPDKADIANYGDFFFNTRNTLELVGKGATWMKNSGEYAFNSNIARFELRNLDTIFFNYLYNTDYMTKQIHARAMGTTSVAAIYPRTLDSVEYLVPCMKEQQKIGAYFKQLDHIITLHQRKCDELKKMKKYMLQNMFI